MNFEPQKFFIGLIDFFSIWLPGAILAYLLKDSVGHYLLSGRTPGDAESWALFLFASYLAGHFIFLIGALLDRLYDRIRDAKRDRQIIRLAEGKRRSWLTTKVLANLLLKEEKALRQVMNLKQRYLGPSDAASAVNAFQWCKAKLALQHSEPLAMVQRMEADSKFFRSLCVVLIALLLWQLVAYFGLGSAWLPVLPRLPAVARPTALNAAVTLLLLTLAFWRYVELRAKAVSQAYWFVITLECTGKDKRSRPKPPKPDEPSRAGGVVVRWKFGRKKYLRVRPKWNSNPSDEGAEWVLPKGHVEPGETCEQAAVREVLEEAGIWARIHEGLADVVFPVDGGSAHVRYFLMEYQGRKWRAWRWPHLWLPRPRPEEELRASEWEGLAETGGLPPESQFVVKAAAERLGVRPRPAPPLPSPRSTRRP